MVRGRNRNSDTSIFNPHMKTLIYGVKCVSAQSEEAKIQLANAVQNNFPHVSDLILNSTYVDDIGDSKEEKIKLE